MRTVAQDGPTLWTLIAAKPDKPGYRFLLTEYIFVDLVPASIPETPWWQGALLPKDSGHGVTL